MEVERDPDSESVSHFITSLDDRGRGSGVIVEELDVECGVGREDGMGWEDVEESDDGICWYKVGVSCIFRGDRFFFRASP